jgi:hypothetical protein
VTQAGPFIIRASAPKIVVESQEEGLMPCMETGDCVPTVEVIPLNQTKLASELTQLTATSNSKKKIGLELAFHCAALMKCLSIKLN